MSPVQIHLQSRSGRKVATVTVAAEASVADLKHAVFKAKKSLPPARQRLTTLAKPGEKRGEVLSDDKTLAAYGLINDSVIQVKDLGPQIGWSTVFFWEYFGPLVIYPLFYFFPEAIYGASSVPRYPVQQYALAYFSFHYAKRILETFLVHRFGHSTMPIFNLFKNCSYYWGFAAYVAYFVNHPKYTPPPVLQTYVCLGAALLCQLGNFWCHIILKNLRKPGEKGYQIPEGFLFNYITCANYSCEIWGWLLFSIGTQTVPAALFTAAGAFQMIVWAAQKHTRLRKIFDGKEGRAKYPRRWVVLPPFF